MPRKTKREIEQPVPPRTEFDHTFLWYPTDATSRWNRHWGSVEHEKYGPRVLVFPPPEGTMGNDGKMDEKAEKTGKWVVVLNTMGDTSLNPFWEFQGEYTGKRAFAVAASLL